jgi:hypothetical protein
MKKTFGFLTFAIILGSMFSCKDSSVETISPQSGIELINRFKNVPWILKSATAGDSSLISHFYDGYTLLLNDTAVFGYDGCNWFDGKFIIESRYFNIVGMGHTEVGCPQWINYNPYMLINSWNFNLTDTSFTLFKNDTTFKFTSYYTRSLSGSTFTNKVWKLTATNDDRYSYLESVGYIFKIKLSGERMLTIRKINTVPNTEYDCTYNSIYFGIGINNSIFIYDRGYTPSCIGTPPSAERMSRDLIEDLLTATNYSTISSTLTLTRISDGRFYSFNLED